jgi:hypothetical protein
MAYIAPSLDSVPATKVYSKGSYEVRPHPWGGWAIYEGETWHGGSGSGTEWTCVSGRYATVYDAGAALLTDKWEYLG